MSQKQWLGLAFLSVTALGVVSEVSATEAVEVATPQQCERFQCVHEKIAPAIGLGAWYSDASGGAGNTHVTFSIYSSRATRLELHLFAKSAGEAEKLKYALTKEAATNLWKITVPVATLTAAGIRTIYYGYRAWGPNWPYKSTWTKGSEIGFVQDVDAEGNRFNPNKLLLDPYALETSHGPTSPVSGNYTQNVYMTGPKYRKLDSALVAPKGIVLAKPAIAYGTKPTRALKDDIVYEVHLRGLTKGDSSVGTCAGTYAGAAQKAADLKRLGVTAVEFLPVQTSDSEANNVDDIASGRASTNTKLDNYWGYMTVNFFAPERYYACDQSLGGPTREFQAMVKAFHDQGIKVWIDVVYNHSYEELSPDGNDTVALLSFRGLDNPTYYSLTTDKQAFLDNTGFPNLNTFNPVTQNLIIDSLKYWSDTLGVDGFRFDLASVLGTDREHGSFSYNKTNPATAINRITRELPPRPAAGGSGIDLIAEPWGLGAGTYQVGNFPVGWADWNDKYRDTFRRDQNELGRTTITPGQLASRFAGSSDIFSSGGRKPWGSINFLVAHDGLTLKDLYSCNGKDNGRAWPYGPSAGGRDENNSWDQAGIAQDQRKAARNGMAFLMLSAGVPMITGGDEFLRSMQCNNNSYNLDASTNWLNYNLTVDQQNFKTFTQNMMAFRAAHPSLRPAEFYSPVDNNGNVMEQLRWFTPTGLVPDAAYFDNGDNHALAYRIDATEFGETAIQAIYVAYNGWKDKVDFKLPWPGSGKAWYRVTDTCVWAEGPNQVDLAATARVGAEWDVYTVCGRGLTVLVAR